MMVYITRRERFNAAHRMYNANWSDEQNMEVYGKCSNPNWHGHNYTLYVTVCGHINPATGYLMNLKTLSRIIRETIIEPLDHRNMNVEVPFMQGKVASSEMLIVSIWQVLQPLLVPEGAELHRIKLEETENNFVEYFGG